MKLETTLRVLHEGSAFLCVGENSHDLEISVTVILDEDEDDGAGFGGGEVGHKDILAGFEVRSRAILNFRKDCPG